MTDEDRKRRLREDIKLTEGELREIEAEKKQREERRELRLEDELRTKSKILQRPLMEGKQKLSGDGPGGDDDKGGVRMEAEGAAGTTTTTESKPQRVALTVGGMVEESIIRRWDSHLAEKGRREGVKLKDTYTRMWLESKRARLREERMLDRLRTIEENSDSRLNRMNELSRLKAQGARDPAEREEMRRLEEEEVARMWLRERVVRNLPLAEQKKLDWLHPLGDGAVNVMPYTYLTTSDLMSNKERAIARWYWDNFLLRWQHAVIATYLPKVPTLTWFKKKKKRAIESMFEDVDEEIYSDKAFAEMVKKGQAQLEDMEEELRGYDRFTVEEERQIRQLFEAEMRRQMALAKEQEMYG
jgi:hypothetical protein